MVRAGPRRRGVHDREGEVQGGHRRDRGESRQGQPVLVGTVSIEKSERLSKMLQRRKVKHVVLNAKYHEREADIIAQAGRKGAVTIATNMAGRGTDIVLGGNPEGLARIEVNPASDPEALRGGGRQVHGELQAGQGGRARRRRSSDHRHRTA